jgi:arginine deiminase
MDEKKIIIKFHKGVTYEVPAFIIAEDRANYYANIDGYERDSQEYLDEINFALNGEYELFDWIQNNMNWDDLKLYAVRVENDIFDVEEEWDKGNHTISVRG